MRSQDMEKYAKNMRKRAGKCGLPNPPPLSVTRTQVEATHQMVNRMGSSQLGSGMSDKATSPVAPAGHLCLGINTENTEVGTWKHYRLNFWNSVQKTSILFGVMVSGTQSHASCL